VLVGSDTLLNVGTPSEYAVSYDLNPAQGDISISASINPQRFNVVAGGSEPVSRAPFYVGLLLLAGMLIAAAVMLTKRQGQLAEARTDFVSNVSHELRTPLAQIRMFAETLLLGRARNDTDKRRSLEIIDQEAKRLTALVENVLQLGRSERGVASVTPTEFRLGPTIREAVDRYAQLPRSMNVEFRTEVEDRLVALVDPSALRQIIDNLLDNAVKYGPSGQRVNVGLAMFEQHARLWVDDEGPGIPVRERERVFEPFFRSTLHAQTSASGSGIGLAVVKELTDLLEGRVWAESAPGGGARIIVEFPKAYLQPEEAAGGWAVA
jgi:signal transduction histidine kinase